MSNGINDIDFPKTVAIIPARGGSKRLKYKNIYPIFDKPMIAWAIEACRRSQFVDEVLVSTEDDEIATVAASFGAQVIKRPNDLADDQMPKMEVIRHADQWLQSTRNHTADIIVSVQANSPELKTHDIDKGIQLLNDNQLFEVISVGSDMIQNASFRVIRQTSLYNTFLSAHIGVVLNECTDVHTIDDVKAIERRYTDADDFTTFLTR